MNANCIVFGVLNLGEEEVCGKRVIEVGSYNVNGSLRPIIESWNPSEYIGVDIEDGPGVDVVCKVEDIVEIFGNESFDIVISTEMLEHIKDWRKAISSMKAVCRKQGIILMTTRSIGFRYHGFPYDFWRYSEDDIREIFSDCNIVTLEQDIKGRGVFAKIRKEDDFIENDVSSYALHSIITNKREMKTRKSDFIRPRFIRCYIIHRLLEMKIIKSLLPV